MKKAFAVIDYQVDFVTGSLGFPEASSLDVPLAHAIEAYRAQGWDILFTLDTHGPDYLATAEGRALPIPHCVKGTDGHQLYGRTAQALHAGDCLWEKETFGSLALAQHLAAQGYDRVVLAGLVAHICVLSNAVLAKAALPQAEIAVDAALTLSPDPNDKRRALASLAGVQVEILHKESVQ